MKLSSKILRKPESWDCSTEQQILCLTMSDSEILPYLRTQQPNSTDPYKKLCFRVFVLIVRPSLGARWYVNRKAGSACGASSSVLRLQLGFATLLHYSFFFTYVMLDSSDGGLRQYACLLCVCWHGAIAFPHALFFWRYYLRWTRVDDFVYSILLCVFLRTLIFIYLTIIWSWGILKNQTDKSWTISARKLYWQATKTTSLISLALLATYELLAKVFNAGTYFYMVVDQNYSRRPLFSKSQFIPLYLKSDSTSLKWAL